MKLLNGLKFLANLKIEVAEIVAGVLIEPDGLGELEVAHRS